MTSIYRSPAGRQKILDLYDSILSCWPVAYDTFTVPTRHGETFIIASGSPSSPPLVLFHGSASNAVSWKSDISEYSRYFRVYAVDLPGEPGISAPTRFPLTGSPAVEWMEDWTGYLKIGQPAILGISLGAWMALRFAVSFPKRVSRLVILAPAGVVQARRLFLLRAALSYLLRRWNNAIYQRLNYGKQLPDEENLRCMEVIADHFRPRFDTLPLFTEEELQRLNMPILMVAGAKDVIFPTDKTAARLQKLTPQVKTRILPEAGHVLYHLSPLVLPFLIS